MFPMFCHLLFFNAAGPIVYQEKVAASHRDFEPVDLEKWWSQRQLDQLKLT